MSRGGAGGLLLTAQALHAGTGPTGRELLGREDAGDVLLVFTPIGWPTGSWHPMASCTTL